MMKMTIMTMKTTMTIITVLVQALQRNVVYAEGPAIAKPVRELAYME